MPVRSKNSASFAGIDIAGAIMRAVVISAGGEVIDRREAPCQPEELVSEITKLVSTLREIGPIKSVGVGIPGLVNRETDRVLIANGLPSAVHSDFHSELMKATGL